MKTNEKGCLVRVMVYLLESILSSALLYQNLMIYLLVLHILACIDDVPDSHCTSTCTAYSHLYCTSLLVWHIIYTGCFCQRVLKKGIIFGLVRDKGTVLMPNLLEKGYILKALGQACLSVSCWE